MALYGCCARKEDNGCDLIGILKCVLFSQTVGAWLFQNLLQVFGDIVPAVVPVRDQRRFRLPGHASQREIWGKGTFPEI